MDDAMVRWEGDVDVDVDVDVDCGLWMLVVCGKHTSYRRINANSGYLANTTIVHYKRYSKSTKTLIHTE